MSGSERRSSRSTGNACGVCGEPMLQCDYGKWFTFFEVVICSVECLDRLTGAIPRVLKGR